MDSASNWKEKLSHFRIKELKDVLTRIGLAKQGKKQDLMDKIVALLSNDQGPEMNGWGKKSSITNEGIVKIIEDIYRKMQIPGATDLASKCHSNSNANAIKPKTEVYDSHQHQMKISCICGISSNTQPRIKCEDPGCRVSQHVNCVIVPDNPTDGVQAERPQRFFCEICRINKADPFRVTLEHPLHPVKLTSSSPALDGSGTMNIQSTERTFQLTRANRELLQRQEYDLQAWCILLNDKVPFRMQWPQYVDLQVNGFSVQTTNRPGSQLLGYNGRDDGAVITPYSREGLNEVCLSCGDARVFCFGIRLVKRRTLQQVLSLIPKESEGEKFEDALSHVCRCIGGGTADKTADSDSDLVVLSDSVNVDLRCPLSGSRMKTAARFKPCVHIRCFDLETFVELVQRSRKWQCPHCFKNYTLEHIIIDPYFNRIISLLQNCGEDVNEIEIRPDGSWRAKNEGHKDLGRWHLPDGTHCVLAKEEVSDEKEMLKQIKCEDGFDGQGKLKLGIKKNRNGTWEVRRSDASTSFSGNHVEEKLGSELRNIPMNSTNTAADSGVNHGGAQFTFSLNDEIDLDSMPMGFDTACSADNEGTRPEKELDVIVLSDSEEDNVTPVSPQTVYNTKPDDNSGTPFTVAHPDLPGQFPDDPRIGTSCLGILGNNEFELPLWPVSTCPQTGPIFQLFNSDVGGPDVFPSLQPNSIERQAENEYGLTSDVDGVDNTYEFTPDVCRGDDAFIGRGNTSFVDDLQTRPNNEENGSLGLGDYHLAFGGDDPSLQIFLSSSPAGMSMRPHTSEQVDMSHVIGRNNWISLQLGGGIDCADEPPSANGSDTRNEFPSRECGTESLTETAPSLLGPNDCRPNKATPNGKRSNGLFSHPRQARSVRPRHSVHTTADSK